MRDRLFPVMLRCLWQKCCSGCASSLGKLSSTEPLAGVAMPHGFLRISGRTVVFWDSIVTARCSKRPDWFSTILAAAFTRPVMLNSVTFFPRRANRAGRLTESFWTWGCRRINSPTRNEVSDLVTTACLTCDSTPQVGRRHGSGWQRLRRGNWSSVCGCGGKRGTAEGSLRSWFTDGGNRRSGREKISPRRLSTPSVVDGAVDIQRHESSRLCGLQSMTSWFTWNGHWPTRCRPAWPRGAGSLSSHFIH